MLTYETIRSLTTHPAYKETTELKQMGQQAEYIKGFQYYEDGSWRAIDCDGKEMGFNFAIVTVMVQGKKK